MTSNWQFLVAALLVGIGIIYRYWRQPNNLAAYGVAWAVEIFVAQAIAIANYSNLILSTVNIGLGLFSLIFTSWLLSSRLRFAELTSFNLIPLLYALLGVLWRSSDFTAYTGLLTLGAAITGIGVGDRHRKWKGITYLSVAAISVAVYELVIYQMLQASGGSLADGFTILAIVAAAIALIYRIFALLFIERRQRAEGRGQKEQFPWDSVEPAIEDRQIKDYGGGAYPTSEKEQGQIKPSALCPRTSAFQGGSLGKRGNLALFNLSLEEIVIVAHIHWAIGSILKIIAAGIAIESTAHLTPVSVTVSLILGAYAIVQARDKNTKSDWWVYVGLVEIAATTVYARLIWTQLSILDPWRAMLVCLVALTIYQMPWQSWGWRSTPWHRIALAMPAVTALLTVENISYFSLLVVAAFYARIAIGQRNIRWSYISLWFIDWGITKFLVENNFTNILLYASIISLSLFYVAQFDSYLITPAQRKKRHYLRIFASSIICSIALIFHQDTGIIPSIISFLLIFFGLGLKIRAFLFVGTITLIMTVFYQAFVLVFKYSFLKWIIGLVAGIILISIAANFERRRVQIVTVFQNWFEQLENWY
ncbi:MAG: hypothetical protein ACRC2R_24045 [Xenococcaceae cyanobacterium]